MDPTAMTPPATRIDRFKLFLALSRTPHGVLDMATPAFAVLLWLGGFPPLKIVLLGMITAFSGYTAVYALNDAIDLKPDKERMRHDTSGGGRGYLDAVIVRHPLAQGLLSMKEAVAWVIGWASVAMVGAYLLNPVCLVIFTAGTLLEIVYCLMWNVSPYRSIVSGFVKSTGGIAAVFAVDPDPSPVFLAALFLSIFFWEIGGQNVPADWTDIDIDARLNARTIPVRFGTRISARLVVACLSSAVLFTIITIIVSRLPSGPLWAVCAAPAGIYLLVLPAKDLYKTDVRENAMVLFNRASYYPPAVLAIAVAAIIAA
ncbi:MAG: UbiA family prenyltransferase [Desulfobacterales bacterium]